MKTFLLAAVLAMFAAVAFWVTAGPRDKQAANNAQEKNGPDRKGEPTPPKGAPKKQAAEPANPSERPPVPTHKATLEVRARTWRDGTPFDIAKDLAAKLLQAGIEVVPKDQKADAMLLAEYSEEKGEVYKNFFGIGNQQEFGTTIRLKLTVLSAAAETLLTLSISASTPFTVDEGKSLYDATLEQLQKDHLYRPVGDFVGGALGIKPSLAKLVPAVIWIDSRKEALAVLERQKYQPADEKEAATLALGRDDFAQCVKIGKPAVEPLLAFLDYYYQPEYTKKAARALGQIGDPRAADSLAKKLQYYINLDHLTDAAQMGSISSEDRKAVAATIEALGRVGDGFVLGDLEPVAKSPDPQTAAAAKAAVDQIRQRITKK